MLYRAYRNLLPPVPGLHGSVEFLVADIVSVSVAPLPTYLGFQVDEGVELGIRTRQDDRFFFRTPKAWAIVERLNQARCAAGAYDVPWLDDREQRDAIYVPMARR